MCVLGFDSVLMLGVVLPRTFSCNSKKQGIITVLGKAPPIETCVRPLLCRVRRTT